VFQRSRVKRERVGKKEGRKEGVKRRRGKTGTTAGVVITNI